MTTFSGKPHYLSHFIAIDTETTGLFLHKDDVVVAVSAHDSNNRHWYWEATLTLPPVQANTRLRPKVVWNQADRELMRKLFRSYPVLVFHNAKFDLRGLVKLGIFSSNDFPSVFTSPLQSRWDHVHDTSLMAHIADNSESKALKTLAARYVSIPATDETQLREATKAMRAMAVRSGYTVADDLEADYWLTRFNPSSAFGPRCTVSPSPKSLLRDYALQDARRTAALFMLYQEALSDLDREDTERFLTDSGNPKRTTHLDHYEVERQLLPVVWTMEDLGMELNTKQLQRCLKEYAIDVELLKRDLQAITHYHSFNPNSPQQVRSHLFEKLRYKPVKTTNKGASSTDKETLTRLLDKHPHCSFLTKLLQYRSAETAAEYVSAYADLAVKTSTSWRLHPSFRANGTVATRFSSQNPNGQNISTRAEYPLRCCFGPSKGIWLDYDYSNLELRLFAYAAGERRLIEAFEQDVSVHLVIAEELYGPRAKWKGLNKDDWKKSPEYKKVKNGNFSLIYGAGRAKADATYGFTGASELVRKKFDRLGAFMSACTRYIQRHGFIHTLFGRRLNLDNRDKPYKAISLVIQGTAGEVLKHAMLRLYGNDVLRGRYHVNMIANIHDELLFEAPAFHPSIPKLIQADMEKPGETIGIPVPVEGAYIPTSGTWDKPQPFPTR